jgi:hypothetical protein
MKKINLFLVTGAFISLTGCGGGGGGSDAVQTVVDAPVESYPLAPELTEEQKQAFPYYASSNYDLIKASYLRDEGFDGTGVTVAVLDTGLSNPSSMDFDVTTLVNQVYEETPTGFQKTTDTYTSDNDNPHGMYMSEVIGSSSYGIAPGVNILHGVISFSNGFTDMYTQQFASKWASENGADFINISYSANGLVYPKSLGFSAKYDQLYNALQTIDANNSVIVHSAGNDGVDVEPAYEDSNFADITILQPDNIIYVGAINSDGTLAYYSNKPGSSQPYIDRFILAPGASDISDGTTHGTSGAAANVTGALALMKSRWTTTAPNALAQVLLDTANKDIPNYDPTIHGQGAMDLYRAMQPLGATSIATSTASSLPMQSLSVSLPAGFKPVNYQQTFFDSIGRDFSSQFQTGVTPYQSRFSSEFAYFGFKPEKKEMRLSDQFKMAFFEQNNRYQSENKIESNLIQMNGLASQMFLEPRSLQGFDVDYGNYRVSFAGNIQDAFDGTRQPINREKGFSTSIAFKDLLKMDYYQSSNDESMPIFYGASSRLFQGLRLSTSYKSLYGGFEYSNESYLGSGGVFNSANIKGQSFFIGMGQQINEFEFGAMLRAEKKDLALSADLTYGNGDGTTYFKDTTLKSEQYLNSLGVYLNGEHFNLSAFKNNFDQGFALKIANNF